MAPFVLHFLLSSLFLCKLCEKVCSHGVVGYIYIYICVVCFELLDISRSFLASLTCHLLKLGDEGIVKQRTVSEIVLSKLCFRDDIC